jgi:hypothetical protein
MPMLYHAHRHSISRVHIPRRIAACVAPARARNIYERVLSQRRGQTSSHDRCAYLRDRGAGGALEPLAVRELVGGDTVLCRFLILYCRCPWLGLDFGIAFPL